MTINENKKLSRNRNQRIDRRINIIDDINLLFKKIKSEKKKKYKNFNENKQIEII